MKERDGMGVVGMMKWSWMMALMFEGSVKGWYSAVLRLVSGKGVLWKRCGFIAAMEMDVDVR